MRPGLGVFDQGCRLSRTGKGDDPQNIIRFQIAFYNPTLFIGQFHQIPFLRALLIVPFRNPSVISRFE